MRVQTQLRYKSLAVLLLLLLFPFTLHAQVQSWSSVVDLTSPTGNAKNPDIGVSGDGTMATGIWNGVNGTFQIQSASAIIASNTASWSSVTDAATVDTESSPRIAVSADGTRATAIWTYNNGMHYIIQSASATISGNSVSWGSVTNLSAPGDDGSRPQLALSPDGTRATAIWNIADGTVQSASATISGNSATWSSVTDLSTPSGGSGNAQIAISMDGTRATAIWQRNFAIQSASATISGNTASWGSVYDLSTIADAISPQIALSVDGTLAIAIWRGDDFSSVFTQQAVATVTGNSATWGTATNLATIGGNSFAGQLAISLDTTKATAVWVGFSGGESLIESASAIISGNTVTWGPLTYLSAAGQTSVLPRMGLSSDGTKASAIWKRFNGSNFVVQTASALINENTATWDSVTDLGSIGPAFVQAAPRIGVSSDGTKATAIWHLTTIGMGATEVIKSTSADIVYPTPTPTVTPTATATSTATPSATATITPLPKLAPRGKASNKAPTPRVRSRNGAIRIFIRDTTKGKRNYYVVVIDTASESVYVRKRIKVSNRFGRKTIKNVPAGSYRLYTYVTRGKKKALHSRLRSVEVLSSED